MKLSIANTRLQRLQLLLNMAALAWMVGASRFAVMYWKGFVRLQRVLRNAIPADQELSDIVNSVASRVGVGPLRTVVATEIASPFIACTHHVQLVWPKSFASPNHELLRSLIAHEAAHVRRRDYMVARLEMIAAIIWWWNPFFLVFSKSSPL